MLSCNVHVLAQKCESYMTVSVSFQEESFHKLWVVEGSSTFEEIQSNIDSICAKLKKYMGDNFQERHLQNQKTNVKRNWGVWGVLGYRGVE